MKNSRLSKACPETVELKLRARGLWPIALEVAKKYFVTTELLLGGSRTKSVIGAKKALYRELLARNFSTTEIGRLLERDASTIQQVGRGRGARSVLSLQDLDLVPPCAPVVALASSLSPLDSSRDLASAAE